MVNKRLRKVCRKTYIFRASTSIGTRRRLRSSEDARGVESRVDFSQRSQQLLLSRDRTKQKRTAVLETRPRKSAQGKGLFRLDPQTLGAIAINRTRSARHGSRANRLIRNSIRLGQAHSRAVRPIRRAEGTCFVRKARTTMKSTRNALVNYAKRAAQIITSLNSPSHIH